LGFRIRELAVQHKEELIIDTTLGHGDSAVRLVNSLQDAGYEVAASTAGLAWQLGIRL
jgi:hypothetical protein